MTSIPDKSSVVLVSGGSRGLGLEIVRALVDAGHRVATFSRQLTAELDEFIGQHSDLVSFRVGDLADPDSLEGVVRDIEVQFGPIDVLINNAAVARDGILSLMRPQDIEEVIRINLTGTLLLTRSVTRKMMLRRRGNVINISSIVGIRGYRGLASYSATKAGLDAATRALARELGEVNIRVNSVAPGYLETNMSESLDPEHRQQIVRRTPLGRLGTPGDITGAILFLMSDQAAFITGQSLVIDGGITC